MRPESIGRFLGISVRLVGRAAIRTIEGQAQPAGRAAVPVQGASGVAGVAVANARPIGRVTGHASRSVARGVGGFLRPFRRIGGILWLEVTGVFFLLPVIVFTPMIWRTRMSWAHGPDHSSFLASTVIVLVFLYLGISSFWRARRR